MDDKPNQPTAPSLRGVLKVIILRGESIIGCLCLEGRAPIPSHIGVPANWRKGLCEWQQLFRVGGSRTPQKRNALYIGGSAQRQWNRLPRFFVWPNWKSELCRRMMDGGFCQHAGPTLFPITPSGATTAGYRNPGWMPAMDVIFLVDLSRLLSAARNDAPIFGWCGLHRSAAVADVRKEVQR